MFVVVVCLRGVVAFCALEFVRVTGLKEADALDEEELGVVDVLLGSVYDRVDVRSEDEYEEEELRNLVSDVIRVPDVLVDVPSARALRSFFIL